jgi:hypothetical protein
VSKYIQLLLTANTSASHAVEECQRMLSVQVISLVRAKTNCKMAAESVQQVKIQISSCYGLVCGTTIFSKLFIPEICFG